MVFLYSFGVRLSFEFYQEFILCVFKFLFIQNCKTPIMTNLEFSLVDNLHNLHNLPYDLNELWKLCISVTLFILWLYLKFANRSFPHCVHYLETKSRGNDIVSPSTS